MPDLYLEANVARNRGTNIKPHVNISRNQHRKDTQREKIQTLTEKARNSGNQPSASQRVFTDAHDNKFTGTRTPEQPIGTITEWGQRNAKQSTQKHKNARKEMGSLGRIH